MGSCDAASESEEPCRTNLRRGRSARKYVVDATPPVLPVLTRCNVIGPSDGGVSDCDIADVFILQRFLAGSPVTVENTCDAYLGP